MLFNPKNRLSKTIIDHRLRYSQFLKMATVIEIRVEIGIQYIKRHLWKQNNSCLLILNDDVLDIVFWHHIPVFYSVFHWTKSRNEKEIDLDHNRRVFTELYQICMYDLIWRFILQKIGQNLALSWILCATFSKRVYVFSFFLRV